MVEPDDLDKLSDDELRALIAGAEVALYENTQWTLQDRQLVAEQFCNAATPGVRFELLYGGAAGGGKTDWMLWHLYHLAITYPGFQGLFLRRTFPELNRSAIRRSWQKFDRKEARWVAAEKSWKFKNGSIIEFGYCESDADVYQYQSAEYGCICFDELTQWPTDFCYTYLLSRLRQPLRLMDQGLVPHMVASTNPGNVGATWVRKRFIDIGEPETSHRGTDMEGFDYETVFVPAKVSDNRFLNEKAYRAQLAGLTTATRRALMDGDWDTVEGQYFSEWERERHVIAPFEIPEGWRRVRAIDYGYTNPMCCLWGAFDLDGNCYIYREFYATELTPPIQARRILEQSVMPDGRGPEPIDYTVADPSIWTRTGAGQPIASQYANEGLHCRKAMNARIDGWQRVRWHLQPDPERANPTMPDYVPPKLFVFSHCLNLIRTLPMLTHSTKQPEDLNTHAEDHAADALRYLLMSRPRPSAVPTTEPTTVEERIAAKHRRRHHHGRHTNPWIGNL